MRFAFASVRVLAVLLALPAAGRAETAWLDAEVRAQEARWAAQQRQTASPPARPRPARDGSTPRRIAARSPVSAFAPPVARSVPVPPVAVPPSRVEAGDLARTLLDSARRHGVDPLLVKAVILAESANRRGATSPKGAMGLMQLMPATARRFGVTDPYDPAQNIDGGTRYLRWLLDRFDGDATRALAGYNAGEGAVDRYGGVPPYRETQDYVRTVQRNHRLLNQRVARLLAGKAQQLK